MCIASAFGIALCLFLMYGSETVSRENLVLEMDTLESLLSIRRIGIILNAQIIDLGEMKEEAGWKE